jgi:hypothetical protein
MARKKAQAGKAPAAKRLGRPPSGKRKPPVPVFLTLRAEPEWINWFEDLQSLLAREHRIDAIERTKVIDEAMEAIAEKKKIRKPPKRYKS